MSFRRTNLFLLALFLLFLLQAPFSVAAKAAAPDGPSLIARVNALLNRKSVFMKNVMTVTDSSGRERKLAYESRGRDYNEKTLICYSAPARIRGQAILMLNNADDIWMYFARTGRVRKLATHAKRNSMEGSDFSFEDIGGGNLFVTDYSSRLEGEEPVNGVACYRLRLTRKPGSSSAYATLVMRIRKSDCYPLVIEYFKGAGKTTPDKRLLLSAIVPVQGVPTARRLTMLDLRDRSSTVITVEVVDYKSDIGAGAFTVQALNQ